MLHGEYLLILVHFIFIQKNNYQKYVYSITNYQVVIGLVKVNHSFGFCVIIDITVSLSIPLSAILGTMLFRMWLYP